MADNPMPWNILMGYMGIPQPQGPVANLSFSTLNRQPTVPSAAGLDDLRSSAVAPTSQQSAPPPLGDQVGSTYLGLRAGAAAGKNIGNSYWKQALIDYLRGQGATDAEIAEAVGAGEGAGDLSPLGLGGMVGGGLLGALGAWGLDQMFDRRGQPNNNSAPGNATEP